MKKLLFTLSLLFCLATVKAQLTYEHTYDSGSGTWGYFLHQYHFSAHGYMYAQINTNAQHGKIQIYNLNHTLYRQFSIPPQPIAGPLANLNVFYLSDSLFNTNSSNFEYLIDYQDSTSSTWYTKVYDDAGNLIFSRDSVNVSWTIVTWPYTEPLFYTSAGYKLILTNEYQAGPKYAAYVYGLPGALPCDECSNGNIINSVGLTQQPGNNPYLLAYPNPSKNSTTIKYELPDGINQGQIVFYNLQGQEMKRFTVDRTFNNINVSTSDLAAGTYLYVLQTNEGIAGSKKMIIIK